VKARPVKKLDPGRSLAENAARIVRVRLDEVRSFVPKALEPERTRQQHDMRIAAKRLRYVLEATEFCFGRPGQVARRRARDLQGLLGELHDCDVMLPRVEGHLAELSDRDAEAVRRLAGDAADLDPELAAHAPARTAYRGLEVLSVYVRARRKLLFDRFVEFWTEQEAAGTWDALDRAADRILRQAKERRRAAEHAAEAERRLAEAERARMEAAERAREAAAHLEAAQRPRGSGGRPPVG
jgi:alpha-D-ribose 1-methylphosphonate 5-triphosphate diphosphatase PhnM